MTNRWLVWSLLLVLIFAPMAHSALHPNHVSLAEIEYNRKTQSFEISLCVWPEDLEKVIAKCENTDSALELTEDLTKKHFPKYLGEKFLIVPKDKDSKPLKVRWVGSEITAKKAWLYFECKNKSASTQFVLTNKLFNELNDDQVNHVKLKLNSDVVWHQLTAKSDHCMIEAAN